MTITTIYAPVNYANTGVGPYTFQFDAVRAADIVVSIDEAVVSQGDYSVVLNGNGPIYSGGAITFNEAPTGSVITIGRDTQIDQEVDYSPYEPFPSETHEFALDKLTLIAQEQDIGESSTFARDLISPVNVYANNTAAVPLPSILELGQGIIGPFYNHVVRSNDAGQFTAWGATLERPGVPLKSAVYAETFDGRAQFFLNPDSGHPLVSETNALATVQFVLDNAGGGGGDPTFNSTGWVHQTSQPNYGTITASYDTEVIGLVTGEILSFEVSGNTLDGLVGYRFDTSDIDAPAGPALPIVMVDGQIVAAAQGTGGKDPGPTTLVTRGWVEENGGGGGGGDFKSDGTVPMTAPIQGFAGSLAAPGYAFSGSLGTGMWLDGSDIKWSVNGVLVGTLSGTLGGTLFVPGLNVSTTAIVPTPTDPSHAATKQYVDDQVSGPVDPVFNTVAWNHLTNSTSYGQMKAAYDTVNTGFGNLELLEFYRDGGTDPNALVGAVFNTTDFDAPAGADLPIVMADGQVVGAAQGTGGKNPGSTTLITRGYADETYAPIGSGGGAAIAGMVVETDGSENVSIKRSNNLSIQKRTDRQETYYLLTLTNGVTTFINDMVPIFNAMYRGTGGIGTTPTLGTGYIPAFIAWDVVSATTIEFQIMNDSNQVVSTFSWIDIMVFDQSKI